MTRYCQAFVAAGLALFVIVAAGSVSLADTDLSGEWTVNGESVIASHDVTTGVFQTHWQSTGRLDMDGLVDGRRIAGEIIVHWPEHEANCPENWRVPTQFEASVSEDGTALTVFYLALAMRGDICDIITDTWRELRYERAVDPSRQCAPPAALAEAVDRLRALLSNGLRRRPGLPTRAMFRRSAVEPPISQALLQARVIVDQQIRNGFSDDYLLGLSAPDGGATRYLGEIAPFMVQEAPCDREEWKNLYFRLERMARDFRNRHRFVSSLTDSVETQYLFYAGRINDLLRETLSDNGILVRIFERAGLDHLNAVRAAQAPRMFGMVINPLFEMSGFPPNRALGLGAAIMSWVTIWSATYDLAGLYDAHVDWLPVFQEYAELYAYLQPLQDHYDDIENQIHVINQIVFWHYPAR